MIFGDIEGQILLSEEVDNLSPCEIDERKLHVYTWKKEIIQREGNMLTVRNADAFEVERKIGYWQNKLSKIERGMSQMQSEHGDVKYRLLHLQRLQKRVNE